MEAADSASSILEPQLKRSTVLNSLKTSRKKSLIKIMFLDLIPPSENIYLIVIFFGAIAASTGAAEDERLLVLPKGTHSSKIQSQLLDMVKAAGYALEEHPVQTEDGYLLTIHRIANGSGPPIFLQHGLLSGSADWLSLGKGKALPYLLADLGYDVWLGNYRGNAFSIAHEKYTPDDSQFWDFSWHEMGIHDLPTMIGYVNGIRPEKLIYIGHSMGATGLFVMATERPELQDKLKFAIFYGPAGYVTHVRGVLRLVAPFINEVEVAAKAIRVYDVFSDHRWTTGLLRHECSENTMDASLCASLLYLITGLDPFQIDYQQIKNIARFVPAGSSAKTVYHYFQVFNSKKFRQYDYGAGINMVKYGQIHPPEYNKSKIRTPMAFFYGDFDYLANPQDVKKFYGELPKESQHSITRVNFTFFNHLDFLWARDAPKLLYNPTIELIKSLQ